MPRFIAVLCLALGFASSTEAQSKLNMFPTGPACIAALQSGNYTVYEPKYFGLHGRNPTNGTTKVRAPLETTACVHMLTTAGMQWVVQPPGTVFRWNVRADGSLELYARDDCGNTADEILYLPPVEPAPSPPAPVPTPQPASSRVGADTRAIIAGMFQNEGTTNRPRRNWGWLKPIGIGALVVGTGLVVANNWPEKRRDDNLSGGNTGGATLRISLP